jgi:hypothetical protein
MRIVVDTTYVLPCFGIIQDDIPADLILRMLKSGHETIISEISIFEGMASAAKRFAKLQIDENIVLTGVSVLTAEDRITKVPLADPEVCMRSLMARRSLNDFVDCLILATGAWAGDLLVTEDREMLDFPVENLAPLNPDFQIVNYQDARDFLVHI